MLYKIAVYFILQVINRRCYNYLDNKNILLSFFSFSIPLKHQAAFIDWLKSTSYFHRKYAEIDLVRFVVKIETCIRSILPLRWVVLQLDLCSLIKYKNKDCANLGNITLILISMTSCNWFELQGETMQHLKKD